MDFDDAMALVEGGGCVWRAVWTQDQYLALNGSAIWKYMVNPPGSGPYTATTDDKNDSTWEHSDRPPRPGN